MKFVHFIYTFVGTFDWTCIVFESYLTAIIWYIACHQCFGCNGWEKSVSKFVTTYAEKYVVIATDNDIVYDDVANSIE